MGRKTELLRLRKQDQRRLRRLVEQSDTQQKIAMRVRIILAAGEGKSPTEISRELHVSRPTVLLWRKRFAGEGVHGLFDAPRSGRPGILDTPTAKIIIASIRQHFIEMNSQGGGSYWIPSHVLRSCKIHAATLRRVVRAYRRRYPYGFLRKRRRAVTQAFLDAENRAQFRFRRRFDFQIIRGAFKGRECCILEQPDEFPDYVKVKFRSTSKPLRNFRFLVHINNIGPKSQKRTKS